LKELHLVSQSIQEHAPSAALLIPTDILTVEELAARLKVNPSWVYENQRSHKPVPALHCGRYLRFSWTAVCTWLAAQPAMTRNRKPARRYSARTHSAKAA
jgi:hypothetical protein